MKPIETCLLFTGPLNVDLSQMARVLAEGLAASGPFQFTREPAGRRQIALAGENLRITVTARPRPLSADNFTGALDSPLSKPARGILSDILFRHRSHLRISLICAETDEAIARKTSLDALRAAHVVTTLLTDRLEPAAVHWRQSNQLLTRQQYMRLAADDIPWALLAHARVVATVPIGEKHPSTGLLLTDSTGLIGRPILFHQGERDSEEMHAAALSFLRHAIETGEPIPHGHTFGTRGGKMAEVRHLPPDEDLPDGRYDLFAVPVETDTLAPEANAPADFAQTEAQAAQASEKERTRSVAVSTLMLAIMPPIGAFLMFLNALAGSNTARTASVAAMMVALAVLVGVYTFLGRTEEQSALLFDTIPVTTTHLSD